MIPTSEAADVRDPAAHLGKGTDAQTLRSIGDFEPDDSPFDSMDGESNIWSQ